MVHDSGELTEMMYRRIYRLMLRNVNPKVIAVTLKLPIKTVQSIMAKLRNDSDYDMDSLKNGMERESYLDIYINSKLRYLEFQIVGMVVESKLDRLREAFEKVHETSHRAIALEMSGTLELDQAGKEVLVHYYKVLSGKDFYVAILNPSEAVEAYLDQFELEKDIPVFGTVHAFETHAVSRDRAWESNT